MKLQLQELDLEVTIQWLALVLQVPMLSEGADNHAIKYREWVRLQEVLMQDYSNDPAAANPSTPFP